jgi:hypothetical protein
MRLPLSAVALVVALTPAVARADDAEKLRESSHAWFDGERQSGWLWGGAGLLSLGAATSLHRFGNGSDVGRGMAYPMFAFGGLQTLIGIGSLARGSGRADELDARIAKSPAEARAAEIARMRSLGLAFLGIEIFEAAVVVGAAGYAATRTSPDQAVSRGVALGLATEGGAMLLLDSLAAARAHEYSGSLSSLSITVAPTAGGSLLSLRGAF